MHFYIAFIHRVPIDLTISEGSGSNDDDNNMFAMMKFDPTITSRVPVSPWIVEIIAIVDRAT